MDEQGNQPTRTCAMSDAALEHALLQERVAAFADGELPAEERRVVDEHLRTCPTCQRELALQQGVARALAPGPARGASAALRRRVEQIGVPAAKRSVWHRRWAAPAVAALVLIGIGGVTALRSRFGSKDRPVAEIPLLRDAIADCRRVMGRNFPRKADLESVGEGLQFPVRALDRPGIELFSTWKTTLAGSPAAGLAYRWRGSVLVQYALPAELIRQQPDIGKALRATRVYTASERGQGIVVFLADGSGTLLVADAPLEELRRLIL
jgi:Putative zinc-finger